VLVLRCQNALKYDYAPRPLWFLEPLQVLALCSAYITDGVMNETPHWKHRSHRQQITTNYTPVARTNIRAKLWLFCFFAVSLPGWFTPWLFRLLAWFAPNE